MKRIVLKRLVVACGAVVTASVIAGCGVATSWDTPAKGTPVSTPPLVSQAVAAARSGDMASLRPHMTEAMAGVLTPSGTAAVKTGLDSLGAVQTITTWQQPSWNGVAVYRFDVAMQRGDAIGFLAEDSSGRIAGLRFEPAAPDSWEKAGKGTPVATPAIVTETVNATLAGDYPALKPLLASDMDDVVTADSVAQMKTRLHYMGALKGITTLQQEAPAGVTDYHFTLRMARGPAEGFLAEDSSGKIVGLRFMMGKLSAKQVLSIAFSR